MRFNLVTCEIFYREMCSIVARSPNQIDLTFMPKGLHDIGQSKMLARLKETLESLDESLYDALLLGYGLCNNGIVGLRANQIPLVVPRAHDCITLFLGNRKRYEEYFYNHPGTYYVTTGWIERGGNLNPAAAPHLQGMNQDYEQLVKKYGEQNAAYLYEELCNLTRNYQQYTYIDMGLAPDARYEKQTKQEAQKKGWKFEKILGQWNLFQRLADGEWDEEDFLIVPPGKEITADYSDQIIRIANHKE